MDGCDAAFSTSCVVFGPPLVLMEQGNQFILRRGEPQMVSTRGTWHLPLLADEIMSGLHSGRAVSQIQRSLVELARANSLRFVSESISPFGDRHRLSDLRVGRRSETFPSKSEATGHLSGRLFGHWAQWGRTVLMCVRLDSYKCSGAALTYPSICLSDQNAVGTVRACLLNSPSSSG